MKRTFISSKPKMILLISLISIFLLLSALTVFLFINDSYKAIYIIVFVILIILISISVVIGTKFVYIVKLLDDRLVFQNIIGIKRKLMISSITNVYIITLSREGTFYILEQSNSSNILAFSYPYKFDYNENTRSIVEAIWTKDVKSIKK